jgi:hypothetical protein
MKNSALKIDDYFVITKSRYGSTGPAVGDVGRVIQARDGASPLAEFFGDKGQLAVKFHSAAKSMDEGERPKNRWYLHDGDVEVEVLSSVTGEDLEIGDRVIAIQTFDTCDAGAVGTVHRKNNNYVCLAIQLRLHTGLDFDGPRDKWNFDDDIRFAVITEASAKDTPMKGTPVKDASKTTAGRYIVAVEENGKFAPSAEPKEFSSEAQALRVATIMAQKHAGSKFFVLHAVAVAELPKATAIVTRL